MHCPVSLPLSYCPSHPPSEVLALFPGFTPACVGPGKQNPVFPSVSYTGGAHCRSAFLGSSETLLVKMFLRLALDRLPMYVVSVPHIPISLNWWLNGISHSFLSLSPAGAFARSLSDVVGFMVLITGLHADNAPVLISSLDSPPELHAACSAFPFGCLLVYIWLVIWSRPKWTCDLSLHPLPVFSVRQRVS